MANNSEISFDLKEWTSKFDRMRFAVSPRYNAALFYLMDYEGRRMQTWAKRMRPWTDRTGDAKRRIVGGAFDDKNGFTAYVAHGVYYGVYLEYGHQRRFAILEKARNRFVKDTKKDIQRLIKLLAEGKQIDKRNPVK